MNQIKTFRLSKESGYIIVFFLFFFPIKTLFYNSVFYIFDVIFTSGAVSEIYSLNYTGSLMGCVEVLRAQETLGAKANTYYFIVLNFLFLWAFGSAVVLNFRLLKHKIFFPIDWILLFMFSFFLVDALKFLAVDLPSLIFYNDLLIINSIWPEVLKYILVLLTAFYLFFWRFPKSVKIQTLLVIFPVTVISFVVWYFYLGPYLLPIRML